jgi:hypothetical protein
LQNGARTPDDWQRAIEQIGNAMPDFPAQQPENILRPSPEQLAADIRALGLRLDRLQSFLACLVGEQ